MVEQLDTQDASMSIRLNKARLAGLIPHGSQFDSYCDGIFESGSIDSYIHKAHSILTGRATGNEAIEAYLFEQIPIEPDHFNTAALALTLILTDAHTGISINEHSFSFSKSNPNLQPSTENLIQVNLTTPIRLALYFSNYLHQHGYSVEQLLNPENLKLFLSLTKINTNSFDSLNEKMDIFGFQKLSIISSSFFVDSIDALNIDGNGVLSAREGGIFDEIQRVQNMVTQRIISKALDQVYDYFAIKSFDTLRKHITFSGLNIGLDSVNQILESLLPIRATTHLDRLSALEITYHRDKNFQEKLAEALRLRRLPVDGLTTFVVKHVQNLSLLNRLLSIRPEVFWGFGAQELGTLINLNPNSVDALKVEGVFEDYTYVDGDIIIPHLKERRLITVPNGGALSALLQEMPSSIDFINSTLKNGSRLKQILFDSGHKPNALFTACNYLETIGCPATSNGLNESWVRNYVRIVKHIELQSAA